MQKDCRLNFKLLSKKTAGQEGLVLTVNCDIKRAGFPLRIRRKTEKFFAFFVVERNRNCVTYCLSSQDLFRCVWFSTAEVKGKFIGQRSDFLVSRLGFNCIL